MMRPIDDSNASPSLIASAEENAAFLGSFDPQDLISEPRYLDSKFALLGALSEKCIEVERHDRFEWSLTPDARSQIFDRLQKDGRLLEVARRAEKNPLIDDLGKWLVNLVIGSPPANQERLSPASLDQIRIARDLLGPGRSVAFRFDINQAIERKSVSRALDQVRANGLIGRKIELNQLWALATHPGANSNGVICLVLSGIGGVGKSALLGEFIAQLRGNQWTGTPIIWLDFDHPSFARILPIVLAEEIARQLGLHSEFDVSAVADFLNHMTELRAQYQDAQAYEAIASSISTISSHLRKLMEDSGMPGQPVVVVCDTFEEVLQRGADEQSILRRILIELGKAIGPGALRVVFSGRTEFEPPFPQIGDPVILGDLPEKDARTLFWRIAGQTPNDDFPLDQLLHKFGGNPLVVKMLGRKAGEGTFLRDILAEDVSLGRDSQLIQGFLYTRILGRLRSNNPLVKKLAHPGLVLRRVTPRLIHQVLSEPCGLPAIDEDESVGLFNELAEQIWLVQRTDDPQTVVHRRDLRRVMLQLISREFGDAAREIHERAGLFYERLSDHNLGKTEQEREAKYHRLFLGQVEFGNRDQAMELVRLVGLDMPCLPITVRAKLKFNAEHNLTPEEMRTLNEQERMELTSRIVQQEIATGQAGNSATGSIGDVLPESTLTAYSDKSGVNEQVLQESLPAGFEYTGVSPLPSNNTSNFRKGAGGHSSPSAGATRKIDVVDVHLAFDACDVDALGEMAREVVDRTLRLDLSLGGREQSWALVESPIWKVALAALATGNNRGIVDYILNHDHFASDSMVLNRRWAQGSRISISFGAAIATVIKLLDPLASLPRYLYLGREFAHRRISSLDELRAWQMLAQEIDSPFGQVEIPMPLLRYMDESLQGVSDATKATGDFEYDLREWPKIVLANIKQRRGPSIGVLNASASKAPPIVIRDRSSQLSRRITHGIVSELYSLLRNSMRSAQREAIVGFTDHMSDKFNECWPHELRADAMPVASGEQWQQWLATLIEFTDRFGELRFLLECTRSSRISPGSDGGMRFLTALEDRLNSSRF